jgi:hypothetical protein
MNSLFVLALFLALELSLTLTAPTHAAHAHARSTSNSRGPRSLRAEHFNAASDVGLGHLPKCKLYEDTFGVWRDVRQVNASALALHEWEQRHFFHGRAGAALHFDKVWEPRGCSYHRFTGETIRQCLAWDERERARAASAPVSGSASAAPGAAAHRSAASTEPSDKPYEIVFMGDSALRGVVCGILRLVFGNEVSGPLGNVICGSEAGARPLSMSALGHPFTVRMPASAVEARNEESAGGSASATATANDTATATAARPAASPPPNPYHPAMDITFTYIKTFSIAHFDWKLEWELHDNKPRVLVMNTGAWDFDDVAREMNARGVDATMGVSDAGECRWPNQTAVAEARSSPWVKSVVVDEMGNLGAANGVRLIYRNNHYQARFGPACADEPLEKMLNGSHWEVWDNKRISHDVWKDQTWDGFHFDRHKIYSEEQHAYNEAVNRGQGRGIPGALEMQLAQSLLNAVFHDCLQHL